MKFGRKSRLFLSPDWTSLVHSAGFGALETVVGLGTTKGIRRNRGLAFGGMSDPLLIKLVESLNLITGKQP